MISKDSKYFNFISLTFVGPTYIAKIGACMPCYQVINTPSAILDQLGIHVTDHFFFLECGLSGFSYFAPLVFLQGPYFSTEGFLGLPKLKDKLLVRTLSKHGRKSIISYKWLLVPFQVWPLRSICKDQDNRFSMCLCTTFFLLFSPCLLCHVVFLFCAGDAHIAALSQVFTHPNKTSVIKKLDLRYVNVIILFQLIIIMED